MDDDDDDDDADVGEGDAVAGTGAGEDEVGADTAKRLVAVTRPAAEAAAADAADEPPDSWMATILVFNGALSLPAIHCAPV